MIRTGQHVEIGAMVTVGRLLETGARFTTELVNHAIYRIGPPPLRNMVTIGGTLALTTPITPLATALQLSDALVELRKSRRGRWVTIPQLHATLSQGTPTGELITRVRLRLEPWQEVLIKSFPSLRSDTTSSLTLLAAYRTVKHTIDTFRFAIVIANTHQIRLRNAENELVGRPLPLNERDRRLVVGSPGGGRRLPRRNRPSTVAHAQRAGTVPHPYALITHGCTQLGPRATMRSCQLLSTSTTTPTIPSSREPRRSAGSSRAPRAGYGCDRPHRRRQTFSEHSTSTRRVQRRRSSRSSGVTSTLPLSHAPAAAA